MTEERTIIFQCPNCGKDMIGQSFHKEFRGEWHCENCGYKGLMAHAYLDWKPHCQYWEHGHCKKPKARIYRDYWRCPFTLTHENNCEDRKP